MQLQITEQLDSRWEVALGPGERVIVPSLDAALEITDSWMRAWRRHVDIKVCYMDGSTQLSMLDDE